jgi:hypothetical protein
MATAATEFRVRCFQPLSHLSRSRVGDSTGRPKGRVLLGLGQAWLARDAWFGINFGILSAIGFIVTYLIVGPPPADMNSGRPQIDKAVLKRAAFRGASIGLAAVLSGAIHREHNVLFYGVELGLVTGI